MGVKKRFRSGSGRYGQRQDQISRAVQSWFCVFFAAQLLLLGQKGYVKLSLFKTVLFYVLALGLVLVVSLQTMVIQAKASKRGRRANVLERKQVLDPAVIAAFAFLICMLISTALSPWVGEAAYSTELHENAVTQSLYVLCFLLLSFWARPTRSALIAVLASTAALCGMILVQLGKVNLFGLYREGENYYISARRHSGNFIGTIGNVDLVSAMLSLLLPICLVYGLTAEKWRKLPGLILALVCGFCMWKIQVMGGLVGVLVGGVISALILLPMSRKVRRFVLLGFGLACAAGLAVLWAVDLSPEPLHELHEILHGRIEDSFGTGRVFIWRQMLERIPSRLWFGFGPDMVSRTGLDHFVRYNSAGKKVAEAVLTDAHCLPLQILYCTGLFSLLSWLAMLGFVLIPWARRTDRSREAAAIGAGLICFLVAMLFTISSVIIMPFFWCLLGLLNGELLRQGKPLV